MHAWACRHKHQHLDVLNIYSRNRGTASPKFRERRRCDLISELVKILKLHIVVWGGSRHNIELDLHQCNDNSCSAQKSQSRQDNPVVVVDGGCSQSKYAYEKMSAFLFYRMSLLTDDTNITKFKNNICSSKEDVASTRWWTKCHALGIRLTPTQIVRIYTQWIEWSHQCTLCLKSVFDTIEAEDSNGAISIEEVK